MAKDKHITRITADDALTAIKKGEDRTDWGKLDAVTQDQLDQIIAEDPDEGEAILNMDWDKAEIVETPNKKSIHLRLDADMLAWFRDTGKGYQSRMNAILRSYFNQMQDRP